MDAGRPRIGESRWPPVCALLVCVVIVALFAGAEMGRDPSLLIALAFTTAMLALVAGLVCFLREIALATGVISRAG